MPVDLSRLSVVSLPNGERQPTYLNPVDTLTQMQADGYFDTAWQRLPLNARMRILANGGVSATAIVAASSQAGGVDVVIDTGSADDDPLTEDSAPLQTYALPRKTALTGTELVRITEIAPPADKAIDVNALFGVGNYYVDKRGAAGDGVYLATGVATSGDATFTATGVSWTSADIGKRIIIWGAGAAGIYHATTIASINSPTSIELTVAPSTTVASSAKAYYGTDDTAVIQAAINATTDGQAVILGPKIYMVSNLTLKGGTGAYGFMRKGFKCLAGMATIVSTGTGDDDYLVASARWVTGASGGTFSEAPYEIERIRFDAFGSKDFALVHKMYWSQQKYCEFMNARIACYKLTRQNQDGSLGTATYPGGTVFQSCLVTSSLAGLTTTYGVHMEGEAGDASQSATDGYMADVSCFASGGMTYGMWFGNTGGWTLVGNRTWSCDVGFYCYQWGKNAAFSNNNWDCTTGIAFRVFKVGTYIDHGQVNGDNYYSDLWVDFSDDATTEVFEIKNGTFHFDPQETTSGIGADGQARIVHNNNRASKTIRSINCTFQAENAHVRNTGNTLGVFDVYGMYSVEDAAVYQRQLWDSGATGVVDRYLHASASPAASDILRQQVAAGMDSGGNVTQYVTTEEVIADATDGSEDATWRVNAMLAGTLTRRFEAGPTGTWVGASNTPIPNAGQVGLGVIGTGYTTSGQSWSRYSADADGPWLVTYKSRSATVGTNTVVNSGDVLARIQARGADGTTSYPAAQVRFEVDGTPGAADMPGRILFLTTADGASSETERMRINSAGSIGIGGSSFGSGSLVVFIANASAVPSTNPTGGGVLYCEGGALKFRGSSGTVTTIAAA